MRRSGISIRYLRIRYQCNRHFIIHSSFCVTLFCIIIHITTSTDQCSMEAATFVSKSCPPQTLSVFPSSTTPGQRGRVGRAFNGRAGETGERGHGGRPGLRGHPGLRGVPGICLTSGCADLGTSGSGVPLPQVPVPVPVRPASRPQSPGRFRGRG